jgi:hypothetical protein
MSLYLHESITPEVIREAKKKGITGVKSYPAGVTTVRIPIPVDKDIIRTKSLAELTLHTRTPPREYSPTSPSTPSSRKWKSKTWS